jgi:hypothetical protein
LIFGLLGLQNPFADQWTWLRIYTHTQLYMLNQNNFSLWWSPINASRSMWQNYPNSRHYMPRKLAFCALKSDDLLVWVCVCVYIYIYIYRCLNFLNFRSFFFFIFSNVAFTWRKKQWCESGMEEFLKSHGKKKQFKKIKINLKETPTRDYLNHIIIIIG